MQSFLAHTSPTVLLSLVKDVSDWEWKLIDEEYMLFPTPESEEKVSRNRYNFP